MKILLVDIETSPNLAYIWDKYEQDAIAFEKERELLSFAYKWLGEKKVHSHCLGDMDSEMLVEGLYMIFDDADIIVAHNGDEFDIKMANAFFIRQGLTPPSPYKTIDTLKIARSKFRFNSNKLNDLGQYLNLGEKVETGGFKLWLKCLKGDKKAWKLMKKYNEQDVILLEKVYKKLVPWAKTTPPIDLGFTCPACGSTHLQQRGWNISKTYLSKRVCCQNCGKWSVSSKKIRHNNNEYLK